MRPMNSKITYSSNLFEMIPFWTIFTGYNWEIKDDPKLILVINIWLEGRKLQDKISYGRHVPLKI